MTLPKEERQQLDKTDGHWLERDSVVPKILELINDAGMCPAELTLLDVGCAVGREVEEFNKHGLLACGLEINSDYVSAGRLRNPNINIYGGDMVNLPRPFDAGSFDVLTCFNTLFYGDTFAILPRLIDCVKTTTGLVIVTIDEKILRLDNNKIIHDLDISKLLESLANIDILHKSYAEREDKEPWPHRHYFYTIVLRRK